MISAAFDPDLLGTFVAVCRHGSMSRAATQAGRAQSAVSTQMTRLEQLVGKRLLHRTGRGVVPTTEGEVLLGYATRILALSEEASARLHERTVLGTVRVGLAEDIAVASLPAALSRLRRSCPKLHLEVVIDHGIALAERWREGTLDVAVAACSMFDAQPVRAWDVDLHWVSAIDSTEDPSRPLEVIVYAEPCHWRRLMFDALTEAERDYRVALTCQNIGAMASAVEHGFGVALLTTESIDTCSMRTISLVPGIVSTLRVQYGLYATNRREEGVKLTMDALSESIHTPSLRPLDRAQLSNSFN